MVTNAEEYNLDKQVVTAKIATQSLQKMTFNHEAFSGKYQNLSDFLQQQAGVQVRNSGIGNPPSISIRGSTHQQVRFIVDGHEINDAQYGGFDLNKLPLQQIDQITVIQGGVAVGGTVQIETISTEQYSSSRVFASSGSFDSKNLGLTHYFSGYGVGLISIDTLTSKANYKYPVPSPFSNPNDTGRIETLKNNQFEKSSTLLKWQSPQHNQYTIGLKGLYLTSNKNQPQYQNNNTENRAYVSSDEWDFQGYLESTTDNKTMLKSEVLSTKKSEVYDDRYNQIGVGHDLTSSTTRINRFKQSVHYSGNFYQIESAFLYKQETFFDDHKLVSDESKCTTPLSTCDLELLQVTQSLTGGFNWFSKKSTSQIGLYIEKTKLERKQQKAFSSKEITRKKNLYTNWNASYINSTLDHTLFTFNLGHAIRIPSLYEVFGDRGLLKSNITLKPEKSDNLSFDVIHDYQPYSISSSLFYRDLSDAIVSQVAAPTSTFKNMAAAQILGIQIKLEAKFGKLNLKLSGQKQNSYTQSEVKASNHKKLSGIFHQSFGASANYSFNKHTDFNYQYQSDQELYTDAANTEEFKHKGRVIHNIRMDYKTSKLNTSLSIDNFLDSQFKDQANRPAPGRTLLLNLQYEIL